MAADDFQAFKKMMVQRNRQMSYENLKRLQRMQIAAGMSQASKAGAEGGGSAPSALAGEEEEEEEEEEEDAEERRQIEEAIRLSRMTFVENDPDLAEVRGEVGGADLWNRGVRGGTGPSPQQGRGEVQQICWREG
jgi:hypothetical protein